MRSNQGVFRFLRLPWKTAFRLRLAGLLSEGGLWSVYERGCRTVNALAKSTEPPSRSS